MKIKRCTHKSFKEGCNNCQEIYDYVNASCLEYGLFEDYDVSNKKDWFEMKTYYEKWINYDPADEEYDDQYVGEVINL